MKKTLYPLSIEQKFMILPAYILPVKARDLLSFGISITIENADIDALKKTYNHFILVNDALRSQYLITIKGIRQYIRDYKEEDIPVIVVKDDIELQQQMSSRRKTTHVFRDKPVCKGYIFKQESKATLYIAVHHIVFDGYSMGLAYKELTEFYEAYSNGKEPELQEKKYKYEDHLKDDMSLIKSKKHKKDCKWWKEKINSRKDFKPILPANKSKSLAATRNILIEKEKYQELTSLCKEYGVPLFYGIMSIASLVIYKLQGKNDFNYMVLGHGRNTIPKKQLIGDLADLSMSFYHVEENKNLKEYFKENFMEYLECTKHSKVHVFEILFRILKTELRLMHFNFYGLIFSNLNIGDYSGEIDSKFNISGVTNKYQPNQFYCMVTDNHKDFVNIRINYQTKAIKQERLEEYCKTFDFILNKILKNKEATIKDVL